MDALSQKGHQEYFFFLSYQYCRYYKFFLYSASKQKIFIPFNNIPAEIDGSLDSSLDMTATACEIIYETS